MRIRAHLCAARHACRGPRSRVPSGCKGLTAETNASKCLALPCAWLTSRSLGWWFSAIVTTQNAVAWRHRRSLQPSQNKRESQAPPPVVPHLHPTAHPTGATSATKAEVEFYFQLDEVLDGGDPCFDTPFTGTKRCIIRKDGWFTNWSWDTCTCKPECGCQRKDK